MDVNEKERVRIMILVGIIVVPLFLIGGTVLIEKLKARSISGVIPEGNVENEQPLDRNDLADLNLPEQHENQDREEDGERRINIRHILVSYKGAHEADESVKLSKEEAYNIALEVRERLIEAPETFNKVARESSDDKATAQHGGLIPGFRMQDVDPVFREAIRNLKPGEISEVVETQFGYHILKLEEIEEGIFQSILIPFSGALHAHPELVRTEKEARDKAYSILEQITEGKLTFEKAAREYSEDPWAANDGYMRGLVQTGSIPHPIIEKTAFSLEIGETSGVIRTPLGYQILRRHKIEPRQACQIVVLYGKNGRVEEEARRRAYEALRELREGRPFDEIVKEFSDESYEKTKGGFTPVIYRGTWQPEIERRLFSMKYGEVSLPFKLDYAWIIIARVR